MFCVIRPITATDSLWVKSLILGCMAEHGVGGPGTLEQDGFLHDMFAFYQQPRRQYFIVEHNGERVGGGGFAPLKGAAEDDQICELQRVFFRPDARGRGFGKALLATIEQTAAALGFQSIYLETITGLQPAIALYEKIGYQHLEHPIGNTGHFICTVFMQKQLTPPVAANTSAPSTPSTKAIA